MANSGQSSEIDLDGKTMTDSQLPSAWIAPEWHSDFADATLELDHLKEFSTCLLSAAPDLKVTLDMPEPGLLYVQVDIGDETKAEIYSVPSPASPGSRRFAIFFDPGTVNEEEVYADSADNAVSQFKSRLGI
jgi:hypothetical protein